MRYVNCIFVLCVLFFFIPMAALAGSLDDPGAPTSAGSAMYTLEDIYNRLNAGTVGAKRTGAFTEPSSGPGSTGHTTDDIMGKAPSVDDTNGAGVADVGTGKKFWGLKSGEWGLQTGAGACSANSAPVAKTGQTSSYATGDDGDLEKGVAWPGTRFSDHGDGTVTDNLTGLMWLKNANNAGSTKTWAGALTYCNDLTDSGYSDWRLPNVKELYSLFDIGQVSPALSSGHPFTGIQLDWYWTSSSNANNPSASAWVVNPNDAIVSYDDKSYFDYVWPVRGGQ